MRLTMEQLEWLVENEVIFTHQVQTSPTTREMVYQIYNHLTGETKQPNGCGRCWRNVKKEVYQQYQKQINIF